MNSFTSEAELAEVVKDYLTRDGWDVYQEVRLPNGKRADFVAEKKSARWIIETKMRANLDVIGQAAQQLPYANCVSVATPAAKRNRAAWAFRHALASFRPCLGWIEVRKSLEETNIAIERAAQWRMPYEDVSFCPVVETVRPGWNRRVSKHYTLYEAQRSFAAAGTSGQYWTPFKQTCKSLVDFVQNLGAPVLLREALQVVEHHYRRDSTARALLSKILQENDIMGLYAFKSGRNVYIALR